MCVFGGRGREGREQYRGVCVCVCVCVFVSRGGQTGAGGDGESARMICRV